ncbi:hypothetical protein A142_06625 [Vibrio splendidus 12E03]|uniref:Uncharacterized protein n=1 Tax=Vibrio splendidus 12E03 TaxID=1191305 RepID=A0A1E5FNW1_VIBSP|nr:hypothetical protein A142_06625 [Vibrio splendidus 12E03]
MKKPFSLPKSPSWPKANNLASAFGAILNQLSSIYINNYVNMMTYKILKIIAILHQSLRLDTFVYLHLTTATIHILLMLVN